MRNLGKLHLKDVILFEDAEFDLNSTGLSVIQGLNLNGTSRSRNAPQNSNAIGKSLFFSQVSDIAYPEGAGGVAKDKTKAGESTLEIGVGKNAYKVTRYTTGKSEKYRISKNGADITPDGVADQKKRISSIMGMSSTAYHVTYYLDSMRPHPLRKGDTASRRAFFTEFFNLTSADVVKKLVANEKSRLKKEAAVLAELVSQESAAEETVDVTGLKERLEKLATTEKRWSDRIEELRELRDHTQFRESHASLLPKLAALNIDDPEVLAQTYLAKLTSRSTKLQARRKAVRQYEDYLQRCEEYAKNKGRRKALLADHPKIAELDDEGIAGLQGKADAIQADLDKAKNLELKLTRKTDAAARAIKDLEAKLESCKAASKKLSDNVGSECSRCGQEITAEHLRKEQRRLAKEAEAYEDEIAKAIAQHDTYATELDLCVTVEQARMSASLKKVRELQRVAASLPVIGAKPTPPEVEPIEGDTEDTLSEALAKLRLSMDEVEEITSEGNVPFLMKYLSSEEDLAYSNEEYDDATARLATCQAKMARIESSLEAYAQQRRERRARQKRIEELKTSLADLEALNVLDKAFSSSSGVKQMIIKSICTRLETTVNRLSAQFFKESYVFHFDLDTQFNIMVTRNIGGKSSTSDVRKLSGAEAGGFDLILAMALISCLPASQQFNTMILDELDSNFGPYMTQAFIDFLPKLLQVVPHVVVITPRLIEYGDQAKYYTVIKQGASSTLRAGNVRSFSTGALNDLRSSRSKPSPGRPARKRPVQ